MPGALTNATIRTAGKTLIRRLVLQWTLVTTRRMEIRRDRARFPRGRGFCFANCEGVSPSFVDQGRSLEAVTGALASQVAARQTAQLIINYWS